MSRVLVTCIGTGDYKETKYQYQDLPPFTTRDMADALSHFFQPDRVLVILTKKAANHENYLRVRTCLGEKSLQIIELKLEEMETIDHLWDLFSKISDALENQTQPQDEILFDLTHGYRSHPFTGLITCAYLQEVRDRKVTHLLYGALEAQKDCITPIWDLSPFLELFDWSFAAGLFQRTGDARELARILKTTQKNLWKAQVPQSAEKPGSTPGTEPTLPRRLTSLASALDDVSECLQVGRPEDLPNQLKHLHTVLNAAKAELTLFARPFASILDQVEAKYRGLGDSSLTGLGTLIDWYASQGMVHQSLGLASEWLISLVCQQIGAPRFNLEVRESVARQINALIKSKEPENPAKGTSDKQTYTVPETLSDSFLESWKTIRDTRNDLLHFGFRNNPMPAKKFDAKAREFVTKLRNLLAEFTHPDPSGK